MLAIGVAAIVAGTAGSLGSAELRLAPGDPEHAAFVARTREESGPRLTGGGGQRSDLPDAERRHGQAQQFALAVSTPGDAQYRHFLTPSGYFQRFGTTAGSVSAVKSWLTGAGLQVTGVEQHNRYVEVSGKVAAAENAFGVSIDSYRHNGLHRAGADSGAQCSRQLWPRRC